MKYPPLFSQAKDQAAWPIFIAWILLYNFSIKYNIFRFLRGDFTFYAALKSMNGQPIVSSSNILPDIFDFQFYLRLSALFIPLTITSAMPPLALPSHRTAKDPFLLLPSCIGQTSFLTCSISCLTSLLVPRVSVPGGAVFSQSSERECQDESSLPEFQPNLWLLTGHAVEGYRNLPIPKGSVFPIPASCKWWAGSRRRCSRIVS